ncbi:MAG: hypothetical protein A2085_06695 [Gemmatimonadetes bacterium GWC2_71_10]|nr:MAG: hypothetical protein A2085_06695 [Gemmatimonadetes bacterium GWC2_71_10]
MSDIRHGTTDELLALRDGEGSAWARAHVEACAACAAELYRLEQVRSRLKALPAMTPPRDRWNAIAVPARRERRARRLHSSVGLAAAAVLAAVTFVAVRPEAPTPAAETRAELDRVMLQSQAMEAALEALDPEQRALPGAAAKVAAELAASLSEVDAALNQPGTWRAEPQRVVQLWRERTGILSALVDVHAGRATFASF